RVVAVQPQFAGALLGEPVGRGIPRDGAGEVERALHVAGEVDDVVGAAGEDEVAGDAVGPGDGHGDAAAHADGPAGVGGQVDVELLEGDAADGQVFQVVDAVEVGGEGDEADLSGGVVDGDGRTGGRRAAPVAGDGPQRVDVAEPHVDRGGQPVF